MYRKVGLAFQIKKTEKLQKRFCVSKILVCVSVCECVSVWWGVEVV